MPNIIGSKKANKDKAKMASGYTNSNNFNDNQVDSIVATNPNADPALGELYKMGAFDKGQNNVPAPTIDPIDSVLSELIKSSKSERDQNINEGDVKQQAINRFQDELDAVDDVYASLISDENIAGDNREGSGRSIQNRQGLIGSLRGQAQTEDILDANQENVDALQAEKLYKKMQILGKADSVAVQEIQAKREAKQAGAAAYLEYINMQDTRNQKNINSTISSMINTDVNYDDLTPEEVDSLAASLGTTRASIINKFAELTPKVDATEGEFKLSEGQAQYRINPETGEVELVAKNNKTYAPKTGSSSSSSSSSNVQYQKTDGNTEEDPVLKAYFESKGGTYDPNFNGESTPAPQLKNLTTSKKAILEQTGLTQAAGDAQSYIINTPAEFQRDYARKVASGDIPANADFTTIDKEYDAWYAEKNKKDDDDGEEESDIFSYPAPAQ